MLTELLTAKNAIKMLTFLLTENVNRMLTLMLTEMLTGKNKCWLQFLLPVNISVNINVYGSFFLLTFLLTFMFTASACMLTVMVEMLLIFSTSFLSLTSSLLLLPSF